VVHIGNRSISPSRAAIRWTRGLACCALLCLAAGCPVEPLDRLTLPGPYTAVLELVHVDDGWRYPLDLSVIYPDADPPEGGWPVILFSTGWNQARASYDGMASQLAEHGFVVVIRYFPSLGIWDLGFDLFDLHLEQCDAVLAWCAEQNALPGSLLYGRCDMTRVGATGHSMGGHVSIVLAKRDPRVQAVVSLDALVDRPGLYAVGDLSELRAPTLYIGAEEGGLCSTFTLSMDDPVWLYDYTPAPRQEILITGADHLDFIQHRTGEPLIDTQLCSVGSADGYLVRDIASRYMIGWFTYFLKQRPEYRTYFDGACSQEDEQSGAVAIRRALNETDLIGEP